MTRALITGLGYSVDQSPYRNGTTHVVFEPPDFIARLAASLPILRANLMRFHGSFAPTAGTAGA